MRPWRLLAFILVVARVEAADWDQWRGPHRNGVSSETGLKTRWDTAPKKTWEIPLGEGFSGVSVVGRLIVTMAGQENDEYVLCLNAENGDERWRYRIDRKFTEGHGNGPRSTPTLHDGRVFALSAWGTLASLDVYSGVEPWTKNLRDEFGGRQNAKEPWRGYATSPLVENGLLLVEVGGVNRRSVVAFHPDSGDIAWTALNDRPAYSSPIAITANDARQTVWFNGEGLVSLSSDGAERWRVPFETSYDQNVSTPLFAPPDKVFISEGYDGKGALMVQIGETGASELWRNDKMRNDFASSLFLDGFIYGFDGTTLKCLDAKNGDEKWAQRGFGRGTLIAANGHLIVLGERGQLAIAEATPVEYRETGSIDRVIAGKCWTAPSLSDGRLYLRDEKTLVCLDLRDGERVSAR
ncbi:MAG: PQQ-binding-like beta-propeller repeat protein [Candidatus Poribacteria bacterium]|nr:PQQ-binding-like beta-propeller repeat protein [Candidatus Poribacteria bacterium]